ncbi:phage tail protein [Thalassomonas viridans]|uniref:Phage tail protein n=1 Tax=Thalassomonas viridans TaxID=137584 RepID=A0AAE9Z457_9GAMM|nr:tail fiber protein [Thalassomonas viridans]WDE05962.1 phage tail protein [Thalassomonas viridans]
MSEPFIAEVRMFGCSYAPRGWAFCDGQILPIAENATLFSLIGTTYGGDGRTTMALPDLMDRAPLHPGQGPGLSRRLLGYPGGTMTETLVEEQIPAHSHTLKGASVKGSSGTPDESLFLGQDKSAPAESIFYLAEGKSLDAPMSGSSIQISGGGQSHSNMQPFLAVNFCIALTGLYPMRN